MSSAFRLKDRTSAPFSFAPSSTASTSTVLLPCGRGLPWIPTIFTIITPLILYFYYTPVKRHMARSACKSVEAAVKNFSIFKDAVFKDPLQCVASLLQRSAGPLVVGKGLGVDTRQVITVSYTHLRTRATQSNAMWRGRIRQNAVSSTPEAAICPPRSSTRVACTR